MDNHYINFFYSLIIHISIIFVFLSILFWTLISKTEEKALYDQINKSIENELSKITINSSIFTESDYKYLKQMYSQENETKKRNNNMLKILNISIIVLLSVLVIISLFIRYYICNNKIDIKEILIENFVILLIVGLIEYLFFKFIASKYVPILPSEIPLDVVGNIKQKLKT